jgi:hypothetical protein
LPARPGALSELPLALTARAYVLLFAGELTAAASLAEEIQAVQEATGTGLAPYGAFGVAALRGDEAEALALIDATMRDVTRRGEGVGITFAEWANAVLDNGLGKYDKAAAAAQRACSFDDDLGSLVWVLPELTEAAARTGTTEAATWACERLEETTCASGTDWALGIRARTRALVTKDNEVRRGRRAGIGRVRELQGVRAHQHAAAARKRPAGGDERGCA